MKDTSNAMTIVVRIKDDECPCEVRKHSSSDGRYHIICNDAYSGKIEFDLVKTSTGRWVAGGTQHLPQHITGRAKDIGKFIESQYEPVI